MAEGHALEALELERHHAAPDRLLEAGLLPVVVTLLAPGPAHQLLAAASRLGGLADEVTGLAVRVVRDVGFFEVHHVREGAECSRLGPLRRAEVDVPHHGPADGVGCDVPDRRVGVTRRARAARLRDERGLCPTVLSVAVRAADARLPVRVLGRQLGVAACAARARPLEGGVAGTTFELEVGVGLRNGARAQQRRLAEHEGSGEQGCEPDHDGVDPQDHRSPAVPPVSEVRNRKQMKPDQDCGANHEGVVHQ